MQANPFQFRSARGFNLIEVSLAIAICSIGLIALIGLLPTGIDASRRAADDTLASSMGNDALNWRRTSPYTNNSCYPLGAPALGSSRPTSITITQDAMGNFDTFEVKDPADPTKNLKNPFYTGPYFILTETVMDNPLAPGSLDTARVLVTVEWPANNTNALNRSKRYFVSDYTRVQ